MREHCVFTVKVALESKSEHSAAEGLRETVSLSGLTAFLQVFSVSIIKVSRRLQRGVGHGCREAVGLHFYSAPWPLRAKMSKRLQRDARRRLQCAV